MLSEAQRLDAAVKTLWCLDMLGKPYQVRLLLRLIDVRTSFTVPELAESCGVSVGLVYFFVASLRRRGVVVRLPRPVEPPEWVEIYGWETLAKRRRETHVTGSSPHSADLERLKALVSGCGDPDLLELLGGS